MNCKECSTIGGCPFAWTEESAQIQNYGCLPTPYEIITMRQKHGKTWACHSNQDKPCLGAIEYQKEKGLEWRVIDSDLVTDDSDWSEYVKKWQQAKKSDKSYTS